MVAPFFKGLAYIIIVVAIGIAALVIQIVESQWLIVIEAGIVLGALVISNSLFAFSELVRCFMDIEKNTRKTMNKSG